MHTLDQYPQRDGLYQILSEGVAVYNRYQKRVMMLDALSSEIWLRADGKTTLRQIALDIAAMGAMPFEATLRTASILTVMLNSEGVMFATNHPQVLPYHLRIPQEEQDAEKTYASMMDAGWLNE
jgi:hypothetical protein